MKLLQLILYVFAGSMVVAQGKKINPVDVAAQYPDAMAVWLERKTDIELTWKNGEIKVAQQEHEDMLFTKDESGNIAGKNSVYFSYFYQLIIFCYIAHSYLLASRYGFIVVLIPTKYIV